ncbi:hypothetical protein [uncultured Flavobacterium sp.]|uniref:hypothetical protein n=1 Tax=uncultured Flavobacterium sp. TaxID=165435 RepID=UPI0030CA4D71
MKNTKLTGIFMLLISISVCGQTKKWNNLKKVNYTINYPNEWELNESGQMGSEFILLSPLSSNNDNFKENINLIIQDLSAYNLDLNKYVEISENQIKTLITEGKIITSERVNKNGKEFQKVIYTGKQGIFNLQYEQYYWVKNNKAFILTLTCKQSEYSGYKSIGEQILNSFEFKTN